MVLSTAGSLVQGTEFFQPHWGFLWTGRIRNRQSHLPPRLCLSPLSHWQSGDPRVEVTCAGSVNTGLAGSKAAFLLPARSGVSGSQRPGMGESTAEKQRLTCPVGNRMTRGFVVPVSTPRMGRAFHPSPLPSLSLFLSTYGLLFMPTICFWN